MPGAGGGGDAMSADGTQPTARPLLGRRAPVAKLAASGLLSLVALLTRDPLALGFLIAVSVVLAPAFGVGFADLLRRAWPVLVAAIGIVLTLALFSADRSGETILHFGPFL